VEIDAMAEFPAPNSGAAAGQPPISAGLLAYALFGTAAVIAIISHGLPARCTAHGARRHRGTHRRVREARRRAGHLDRLALHVAHTDVLVLLPVGDRRRIVLVTLGLILIGIPIALLIWFVASIWVIYRVIRGYLLFKDSKPIPGV
jgi:hypothetical protein